MKFLTGLKEWFAFFWHKLVSAVYSSAQLFKKCLQRFYQFVEDHLTSLLWAADESVCKRDPVKAITTRMINEEIDEMIIDFCRNLKVEQPDYPYLLTTLTPERIEQTFKEMADEAPAAAQALIEVALLTEDIDPSALLEQRVSYEEGCTLASYAAALRIHSYWLREDPYQ